jgi:ATP-dependent helicase/nuclease subunit B
MVPSRLLQRLKAFAGDAVWARLVAAGERYRALARQLDEPIVAPEPLPRPAPKPDSSLIPRTVSVTEVETLVRDPYAIFARHILKLDPLDAVAASPTAAYRGTMIHDILGSFTALHPNALPEHAAAELLQRGEDAFRPLQDAYPKLYAEWWPRFKRLATAFIAWERNRRADILMVHPEVPGRLPIPLITGDEIVLRVRADRIEARRAAANPRSRDADGGGLPRRARRDRDARLVLR